MAPQPKKGKSKAKGGSKSPGPKSRSPSPKHAAKKDKTDPADTEKEKEERYAILRLPKDDRQQLLQLGTAVNEACGSLTACWSTLVGKDAGKGAAANDASLTLTQFSVGISNSGVHKANAKLGGDTIDAVACYHNLHKGATSGLSYKEFMALSILQQDHEVRVILQGVEKVGDKQILNPLDRTLVELWHHILPYRSSSLQRKMPTVEEAAVCTQYLKAARAATTAVALVKFETKQLATAGVLVIREVLMTYSRSMAVVQEVMQLASCWAGIPTVRMALYRTLKGALGYVISHLQDGVTEWNYQHLENFLALLKKFINGGVVAQKVSSPTGQKSPPSRRRTSMLSPSGDVSETPEEREISEMQAIMEVSQRVKDAESMYEAALAVDEMLGRLRQHSSSIMQTLAQYASGGIERMRQAVCEYPAPFVADFVWAETNTSGKPGAPIQSTSLGGRAEAAGVLPGWRALTAQRGTKANPEGDAVLFTDCNRAQQLLDRWAMRHASITLTFEGSEIIKHTDAKVGDTLNESGKQAMVEVCRPGMSLGAIPLMDMTRQILILGGHWRHGVENFEELVRVANDVKEYYELAANHGPPERAPHLCYAIEGVPDDLKEINAIAQTFAFIGERRMSSKEKAGEEDVGLTISPWRPRSARPYDRLRRPLSPRAERPRTAGDTGYNDVDFVLDLADGATPATTVTSRPMSAVSRPMSAAIRPKSAASTARSSRPTSAAITVGSRPMSAVVTITKQKPRPMSAATTTGMPMRVLIPGPPQTRPASAPSGRKQSWLYRKPSKTTEVEILGRDGIFRPPKRPAGPWTRKCRENGVEVLRHKLTSSLMMSGAKPF